MSLGQGLFQCRFAESWWKAFHRRRPVTASKAATSRRSQEEEEEDVSTDVGLAQYSEADSVS